jgi:sortase B
MKKRMDGLDAVTAVVRIANRILNAVIVLVLAVGFLYSGYGLWDTWQIYRSAGVNSEMLKYKPGQSDDTSNPSFAELQAINPDVCAWVTVDGTDIDYPVVQGESNFDYLNKAVDGSFSLSGSVFLDYRNKNDFSDFYSLLFAHHMDGNRMFGALPDFQEKDYFQEHTSGTLYLPGQTYSIEWFSCIYTDAYDTEVFNTTGMESKAAKTELLEYLEQKAVQYRDIGVTESDKVIGLSTCADATTDGRVLLFGRMCEKKE